MHRGVPELGDRIVRKYGYSSLGPARTSRQAYRSINGGQRGQAPANLLELLLFYARNILYTDIPVNPVTCNNNYWQKTIEASTAINITAYGVQ